MEYVDKAIPLVVLGIAAAFLVILTRRVARETGPRVEVTPVVETPAIAIAIEPAAVEVNVVVPAPVVVQTDGRPRRRRVKKAMSPPPVVKATSTPLETVLGLLKEKESLTAAFVLHEILGPPVSKRGERPA